MKKIKALTFMLLCGSVLLLVTSASLLEVADDAPRRARILFLGHEGARVHNPTRMAAALAIPLFDRGISITYTADTSDLNAVNLAKYDGVMIYANIRTLSPETEKTLKDFVESGKGLIPIHAASATFNNSPWYVSTVGATFKRHDRPNAFKITNVDATHPVMEGVTEFTAFDEPYEHANINADKIVLQERIGPTGAHEPWTWVRNQGKGRVFYTAGGHIDSTWNQPSFQKLIGNGILWAVGDKVNKQVTAFKKPVARYNDTTIVPNYERRNPAPKFQYAFTPEESMALIEAPVDFDVKLFAAEPDITNPIAMSWDEKGRLWIVESVDYPNTFIETDGAANDRIKICEDTNGDGKADKFTVFADKLNIPTSMVFANGGVIVSMAPNFVFLKDTNGDDKADIRQNIITGWGKNDTHAGPSNLLYGFDNKIWGVVGYSGFNGIVDNKSFRFAQGVYRFDPNVKNFEFLANSNNNTWGLGFSEDNDVFVSTANGNHSDYYSMPYQLMQRTFPPAKEEAPVATAGGQGGGNPGFAPPTGLLRGTTGQVIPLAVIQGHGDMHTLTPNLRQVDVMGGFTAAAGHHFYTARNFPKEYWNRVAFVNEPTGRLIHNSIIQRDGAGYKERDGWNLLASSDEWFGPVHTEVGPDGAVWVADWYNFIIQHNPTPGPAVAAGKQFKNGQGSAYVTPMRDIDRGRIYRVVYKNAKPYTPIKLSKTNQVGLLSALENDNKFWRMTAQRLMVETNNQAAIPGLIKIVNNKNVDEIGINGPAINALWTLKGLSAVNRKNTRVMNAVIGALSHPSAAVRKAAVGVLPKDNQTYADIKKAGLLNDPDLNVRMNVIVTIAQLPPSTEAGKDIYNASLSPENEKDEWIAKALFAAASAHEAGFSSAAPKGPIENVQTLSLTQRISKGLSSEVYTLTARQGTVRAVAFSPDVVGKEIIIKASILPGRPGGNRGGGGGREGGFGGGGFGQPAAPIDPNAPLQGFIVGQGGKNDGYGLYIQNEKLVLLVRQDGKSFIASSDTSLPKEYTLEAKLLRNGEMSIDMNGQQIAKGKAPGLFTKPLELNLRASQDLQEPTTDKIGEYTGNFPFTGTIQNGTVELKKQAN